MTDMDAYFNTKQVLATSMSRQEYNDYRGWTLPEDENGWDQGYLVEDVNSPRPNHPAHAGYISWLPKEVFEKSYASSGSMNFGQALEALKRGYRVARSGWNGKGMWLSLSCGETRLVPAAGFWSAQNRAWAHENGGFAKVLPSITMKTATGEILMGWLASQTDILAEDWMLAI